jgi:hypothetical protein
MSNHSLLTKVSSEPFNSPYNQSIHNQFPTIGKLSGFYDKLGSMNLEDQLQKIVKQEEEEMENEPIGIFSQFSG